MTGSGGRRAVFEGQALHATGAVVILAAAACHALIWVHYFATERPDLRRIYGPKGAGQAEGSGEHPRTGAGPVPKPR